MRASMHSGTHKRRVMGVHPSRLPGLAPVERLNALGAVLLAFLAVPAFPTRLAAQNPEPGGVSAGELQLAQPIEPGQALPHITLSLQDALDRAEKNDAQLSAAITDAKIAREDHIQARATALPSASLQTSALLTQGNGVLPTGRYVTNDGVHVYRQWAVVHQDFSLATITLLGDRRGAALEALARARAEIARRGLRVTVTKDYCALVVSQRKYATAQESARQAEKFLEITQNQERQGQVAHSDVIKAQIQFNQERTALQNAQLQMENDRLTLAVLVFPSFTENFSVIDDLEKGQELPPFAEIQEMAGRENPEMRAVMEAVREANMSVSAARFAMLPSVSTELDYGIEANAFALRSRVSADPQKGPLPNLGYFATITLNLPVWDWGSLRSKLRQAEYHRQQAKLELTQAQRQMMGELYSSLR